MDYRRVKSIITARLSEMGVSTQKMAQDLGFSPQGYRKWFIQETLRVKTVIEIAEYLDLDPETLLFGGNDILPTNNIGDKPLQYTKKKYLEQRVDDLETRMDEVLKKLSE